MFNAGTSKKLMVAAATAGAMLAASPLPASAAAPGATTLPAADPELGPTLAGANNAFAVDFFRQGNPKTDQNAFLSPYSISAALAMTWAGAHGATAAQMARTLHLSDIKEQDVTPGFKALGAALAKSQERNGAQLSIANSLWPDASEKFLSDYVARVQNDFSAALVPVDFRQHADDGRQKINAWVADQTKNKIKDILHPDDVGPSTSLVLVNAIYFKGAWSSAFNESQNVNDLFHMPGDKTQPVVLMHKTLTRADARYADFPDEAEPFQMVAINYFGSGEADAAGPGGGRGPLHTPGDFSFVVLLPHAVDGEGALEKAVTAESLNTWVGKLGGDSVEVFLPKFHIEQRFDLSGSLQAAGMNDAFNPQRADFSGMTGDRTLFISKAIHQTFIDVDEKGTEAAAATAIMMTRSAVMRPPTPTPVFRADHPFLFLIRENTTGSILFLGRLATPTTSG